MSYGYIPQWVERYHYRRMGEKNACRKKEIEDTIAYLAEQLRVMRADRGKPARKVTPDAVADDAEIEALFM